MGDTAVLAGAKTINSARLTASQNAITKFLCVIMTSL